MAINGKLFAVVVVTAIAQSIGISAWAANVSGAGSTFVSPVLTKWANAYKNEADFSISYQSVGSVTGIMLIKSNRVDFAASDAPLKAEEVSAAQMIQFPIVVGGVVPVVNLRGVGPGQLKLTGPVIADIYLGKITNWNDKAIADLNPQLALPDQAIVPVHRAADSGTRYLFSDYLAKVSPGWKRESLPNSLVQVLGGIGARGNELVAAFTASRKGAIGYVEFAYAKQHNLAYVLMQNRDGAFVAPNNQSFSSAASHADWSKAPAFQILLTDQPGMESWPISGSTFVLVYKDQHRSEAAAEMFKFFDWVYRNGAAVAGDLDYSPIPSNVVQLVENRWADIMMPSGQPLRFGGSAAPD
jgi:phosphate transport system substrate-binding protein